MAGVVKQIIGSFEDIGKDVVRETIKVPADVVGKALESLSATGGKKQQGSNQAKPQEKKPETGPLADLTANPDRQAKKAIARAALSQLAFQTPKQPTEYETKQREEQEKKEQEKRQKEFAGKQALPKMSSKPKRGNLYGIQGKSEQSKNVRQD